MKIALSILAAIALTSISGLTSQAADGKAAVAAKADLSEPSLCAGDIKVGSTLKDFEETVQKSQLKQKRSAAKSARVQSIFEGLDTNKDGKISLEELKVAAAKGGTLSAEGCGSCDNACGADCHCHQNTGLCGKNGDGSVRAASATH